MYELNFCKTKIIFSWLVKIPEIGPILYGIKGCYSESQYEDLLKRLADLTLDEGFLESFNIPKKDSIYNCEGPFKFEEYKEEEEYDAYWDGGCPLEDEE